MLAVMSAFEWFATHSRLERLRRPEMGAAASSLWSLTI